jgi:hypothetical protein
MVALTTAVGLLLTNAPLALAHADGGQGWWGESTDGQVTNVMFGTLIFFPVFIALASLLQWWLDKRHHAREDARRAREMSADWRGGW